MLSAPTTASPRKVKGGARNSGWLPLGMRSDSSFIAFLMAHSFGRDDEVMDISGSIFFFVVLCGVPTIYIYGYQSQKASSHIDSSELIIGASLF